MRKTKYFVATLLIGLICCSAMGQGLLQRGNNARDKGLDGLAEDYYRQASDTNAEARMQLGLLLQRLERYADAAHWLSLADTSAASMTALAECQIENANYADARTSAEKAIELADTTDSLLRSSAMVSMALVSCHNQNFTNALDWIHRAEQECTATPRLFNAMGVIHFRRGNDAEAIRCFNRALKADPHNTDASFNLGAMHCYRGNHDMAINVLRKGLKQANRSVKLYYCLGWAYLLKGDSQRATQCLQTVLDIDSMHVNAHNRMGDIFFSKGQYNEAIDHYRRAARIAPHLPEAQRLMGRTYTETGQFAKALSHLQRAANIDPTDHQTYCLIAELYERQRQPKRAQANYKRAARLGNEKARQWCVKKGVAY